MEVGTPDAVRLVIVPVNAAEDDGVPGTSPP
jgi:hypothetical protein